MNASYNQIHAARLQERYALRVAARLTGGLDSLPHDITERLRAARERALVRRPQPQMVRRLRWASAVGANGNTAVLHPGGDGMGMWGWLASAALAAALVTGLAAINIVLDDNRAVEVADVDTALLTDDLPPQAYADQGFLQYLKAGQDQSTSSR